MKKVICLIISIILLITTFSGCDSTDYEQRKQEKNAQLVITSELMNNQPTPKDIDYSLERYNLTRRAYWVNGQREKAKNYPCPVADIPLGYVVLLTESGSVIGNFVVEGKVTSLNSYLTPDSEAYEGNSNTFVNEWLADVDGSYGQNDNGIFFFTPDGKYIEWTGIYLYSDIPFEVEAPVLKTIN